ncbi:hypothetical protein Gotur_025126, partial [Gossypium turneri]
MERGFLDKVKDNVAVRIWSDRMQQEKCDSLAEGYVSELWGFTQISVTQDNLHELKEIWDQWGDEVRQLFYSNYGDLPYLLDIKIDKHLFRALAQFWNPAYSCFTFGKYVKKMIDVFTLSIYGLVVFLKALRSLNACRRVREGRFIGCAQLLLVWFHSHFEKVEKVSYRVFSENYSLLKELVATQRRDDIKEGKWMTIFQ